MLLALISGPTCTNLSAVDRAIMLEQEIDELISGHLAIVDRIEEAEQNAANSDERNKTLAEALKTLVGACEKLTKARSARVGALVVPDVEIESAERALVSAVAHAKSVLK